MSEVRLLSDSTAEVVDGCPKCGAALFKIKASCRCPAFDAKLICGGCGEYEMHHTFNPGWKERHKR